MLQKHTVTFRIVDNSILSAKDITKQMSPLEWKEKRIGFGYFIIDPAYIL